MIRTLMTACSILFLTLTLLGSDWPLYKGNIYFTGNNDEIIVPNGNLKWLYQAGDRVYNPVVSDGKIYFIDQSAFLYCLAEQSGRFLWKISIRDISAQFKRLSRAAGKIKYPLIKGDYIYLTDPVAIYCINKHSGKVLWARTAATIQGTGVQQHARISGIYSDPIITDSEIYYGTRNSFYSRNLLNGHENWSNDTVQSYSGFPTFYDDFIIVQSMNYSDNSYHVLKLNGSSGNVIWKKKMPKPFKIFPPVVYNGKLYIPVSKKIHCLDLESGKRLWSKEYNGIISSNPSFTDRSILFTLDNSRIMVTDPQDGSVTDSFKVEDKASPHYVMVRNQIYVAYNGKGSSQRAYGYVRAVNFNNKNTLWTFKTPFPGAVSQPLASNGILFLPAGNYLYAIGAESYPQTVQGGSAVDTDTATSGSPSSRDDISPQDSASQDTSRDDERTEPDEPEINLRDYKIKVTDEDGNKIPARASIEQHDDNGNKIYSHEMPVSDGKMQIPEGDDVHVVVDSDGYLPEGFSPGKNEEGRDVALDTLKRGQSFVVNDITFEVNKAYLRKQSLPILRKLLLIMKQNSDLTLHVHGHTDSTGADEYNMHLSERRADAVAEYMIKNGISPERIVSKGFGETKPVASNETAQGRKKNRRTEFTFK